MKLIAKIKYRFAWNNLKQEHQKLVRTRKPLNLDSARYIAVIYPLTDEGIYRKIEEFVKTLNEKNNRVKVVCYTELKYIPHFYIPRLLQDILTVKDINWKYIPVKPFVKDFLADEFDILIDLSLTEHFPLLYLAALSKAGLKIGRYEEKHQDFYDLMIELPENASLDYFAEQVIHYLNKINTES